MRKNELEILMQCHQMELYRYVQFLGADQSLADDIVQEVFISVYYHKNLPDFGDVDQRIAWLRSVAKNLFYKQCRKHKRQVNLTEEILSRLEFYWDHSTKDDALFLKKEALVECLKTLPEKQSIAIQMRYKKRLSRQQMAEELKMSENGIKSFLQRLRQALGKCIKLKLQESR